MRQHGWPLVALVLASLLAPAVSAVPDVVTPLLDGSGSQPSADDGSPEGPLPDRNLQELKDAATESGAPVAGPVGKVPLLPEEEWSLGDVDARVVALASLGALGLLGAGLYMGTRYVTRDDVLANDVRGRIFTHIKTRTGANLKQITDDLHLTTTNAIWHLRKLEEAGLVHSRRFNGYKVFYAAEGGVEARRMSLSITALQNENAQEIFEYVVANPGTHQREIARALGVNHGTVRWHLKKLRRAEIVDEVRKGKTATYFATDLGRDALARVAGRDVHAKTIPLADGRTIGA